jgi:hypothetical protein
MLLEKGADANSKVEMGYVTVASTKQHEKDCMFIFVWKGDVPDGRDPRWEMTRARSTVASKVT